MRANWAEISLGAVQANVRAFRRRLGGGAGPAICAVVKANAYGHGLVECAQAALAAGAEWLAVTDTAEAVALCAAGIGSRILVLGDFDGEDAAAMVRLGLTPTVWTEAQARRLARAADPGMSGRLVLHLKVDTGMARLGTPPTELAALARRAAAMGLRIEAIYTHLASAEGPAALVHAQMRRFQAALGTVDARLTGQSGFFWHAANSAAAWIWARLDQGTRGRQGPVRGSGIVRVGLGLYGNCLAAEAEKSLRPALTWKTRVIALREIPAGAPVGYGGDQPGGWRAKRRARIATVACGYADGYFRTIANAPGAYVLLRGQPARFAGRISMDLMSLEATAIPGARVGDEVVLIGRQGQRAIGTGDVARWAGTIPYEITCALAARVRRVYV